MRDVRRDVWEHSKRGTGPCEGCPEAGSAYNHPGFFNPDAAVLVVEESPSKSHFNFVDYDRSKDVEWYRQFFEEEKREAISRWPPVELFLEPVFGAFGLDRDEILEAVYMTSAVKCVTRDLDEPYHFCRSYLARELKTMAPDVVIATGSRPAKWTARLLGVPASDTRSIKISKPECWGLSDYDTDPPLIHVPHWGYYNTHHRLSDAEWEQVIRATREGLRRTDFQ